MSEQQVQLMEQESLPVQTETAHALWQHPNRDWLPHLQGGKRLADDQQAPMRKAHLLCYNNRGSYSKKETYSARRAVCHSCGKYNHYARVCRSSQGALNELQGS